MSKFGHVEKVPSKQFKPDECAHCHRNEKRQMHPEDLAIEATGKKEGAANIDAFFARNQEAFKALIGTYGDGHAEMLFEQLRERFWSATPVGSE